MVLAQSVVRLSFRKHRWKLLVFMILLCSCLYLFGSNKRNYKKKLRIPMVHIHYTGIDKLIQLSLNLHSVQVPKNEIQNELEFQMLLENAGVSAFLVEPRWLVSLLSEEDHLLLKRREVDVGNLSRSDRVTTYGIFEEISVRINEKLVNSFESNSYSYGKTEALDARKFHWDETKNKNFTLTAHHFFVKRNHVFHLAVFFKRKTFLWSSAVTSLPSTVSRIVKLEEFVLGRHATAFEKFQAIAIKYSTINYFIRVPSDVIQFLSEMPSSKFLECNHQVAHQFYAKNWKRSKPNMEFNYVIFSALSAVKNVLRPLLIPFWISSGTVLGWYRQCNIIPYTSDIDLSAWARDIDSSLDTHVMKNQEKLILRIIYGIPWESYQYVFTFYNLRVDFFFTYKDVNNYWYGGHGPEDEVFFHYNYPKFVLCSGELVGQKVLVPCNPEEVISAEYGINWHIPVEEWNYAYSAFNIGTKFRWPKDLVNKTHIYL